MIDERGVVSLIWSATPGPRVLVVVMSVVAGLANGAVLATVNDALAARADDELAAAHGAAYLVAMVVFVSATYFSMYRATEMAGRLMHGLRTRIASALGSSSLRAVETYGQGEVIAHITNDVSIIGGTAQKFVGVAQSTVIVAFCLGYLAWLSVPVLAVTLVFILVGVGLYFWTEKAANTVLAEARAHEAHYLESVTDALRGFKEMRLSRAMTRDVSDAMLAHSDRFTARHADAEFVFYKSAVISTIGLFAMLGVVAFVPVSWLRAQGVEGFQILGVLIFMLGPLVAIVDAVGPYLRARNAHDRLRRLARMMDNARESDAAAAPTSVDDALVLHGAELRYRHPELGETFVLGPLDVRCPVGRITFLAGGNGSGKTSLMKLLAGLYVPDAGELRVGEDLIDDARRPAHRENVAAVFSDFHLFARPHGLGDIEVARLERWIADVGLGAKVDLVDGRFTTTALSAGQRKRLALAVVLCQERPVVLLDEFGAEQDPEFRAVFYRELLPRLRRKGTTVVAATHDDAFFDCCDHLVKLDLGQVVYAGPPGGLTGRAERVLSS